MNKTLTLALLSTLFGLASCEEDNSAPNLPMEVTVDPYSNVLVDGKARIIFSQATASPSLKAASNSNSTGYMVKIRSTAQQRQGIHVDSEEGTLTLRIDDHITLADSVTIELFTAGLDEIRLESDQVAEFIGVFNQEALAVVTEARSRVSLIDFKVDYLTCRTEGESEIELINYPEALNDEQTFEESRVVQIDDHTLLVDNAYIVTGNEVIFIDGNWTVSGENAASQYFMHTCNFITQGETYIDAIGAPSRNIQINLEGESEANVWAFDSITGKGEGNSTLFHVNVYGLNTSNFITQGNARIIPVN